MSTSRATKKKYVQAEILQAEPKLPESNQQIVKVLNAQGNNLYQVQAANDDVFLVSMPMKFRKTVWVKRNDYVVVENIDSNGKVKGEMVTVLTPAAIKFIKSQSAWPEALSKDDSCCDDKNQELHFIDNPNRLNSIVCKESTDSDTE